MSQLAGGATLPDADFNQEHPHFHPFGIPLSHSQSLELLKSLEQCLEAGLLELYPSSDLIALLFLTASNYKWSQRASLFRKLLDSREPLAFDQVSWE